MPPPVQIGERDEPARARPVPFWRHGLAPPPRTLPRVLVDAVPWRRALSSARTDSWTSGPLKRAPKATSSSATFFVFAAPRIGASAIGAHLHDAVARARHGAAHEQQVVVGVHAHDHDRPFWVTRLLPIWPGPRMPLKTRAGYAAAPIEPGARTLCEPCDLGPLAKPWRLIVPWKPLPLETPEILTRSPSANASALTVSPTVQLAGLVAELDHVLHGRRVGLLEMSELGLGEVLLLDRPNASWTAS